MRLLLLLAAASLPLTAMAGIYKWQDQQGRIHYSDTPPAHQSSDEMKGIQKGSEAEAERARRSLADKLTESRMQRQQAEEAEKKQRAAEEKKRRLAEACEKARARLAILHRQGLVAQVDAQGQRKILSTSEREAAVSETQQRIAETCQ